MKCARYYGAEKAVAIEGMLEVARGEGSKQASAHQLSREEGRGSRRRGKV